MKSILAAPISSSKDETIAFFKQVKQHETKTSVTLWEKKKKIFLRHMMSKLVDIDWSSLMLDRWN